MVDGFNSLGFAKKLQTAAYTREQAETLAEMLTTDVVRPSAATAELDALEAHLTRHIERVEERGRHNIEQVEKSILIKLGVLTVGAIGLITAVLKLFGKL